MAGRWIDIGHEGMRGFLALPRAGSGPGLLMLCDTAGVNHALETLAETYAEEGYVVLAPDLFWRAEACVADAGRHMQDVAIGMACLRTRPECTDAAGVVGFGVGGRLAFTTAMQLDVEAVIVWSPRRIDTVLDEIYDLSCPVMMHVGETDRENGLDALHAALDGNDEAQIFVYPGLAARFDDPESPAYDKAATLMAYSRTIGLLRQTLGPAYDLSALWEEHTFQEFGARNAAATMQSMVAQPYVNHIPTMTGGVGHDELLRFYRHHFIPKTPADTRLIPLSRTVGADRLVDEMLFCFTHDIEIDWMLPGVPPTGRYVEIPLVAIVRFRGDKLYNEHIYWDQASVLVQIGKLDPAGLPVAGVETARKLLDEDLPSNSLMRRWGESA